MALLANLPVAVQADDVAQLAEAPPEVGIDELIRRKWRREEVVSAPRCDDRTFVRRVYLDLAGRIPTPSEVATFLTDGRTGKRDHLVDVLLASEDHVQHVADVLDAELMGRAAADKYAERTQFGWRRYLEMWFGATALGTKSRARSYWRDRVQRVKRGPFGSCTNATTSIRRLRRPLHQRFLEFGSNVRSVTITCWSTRSSRRITGDWSLFLGAARTSKPRTDLVSWNRQLEGFLSLPALMGARPRTA